MERPTTYEKINQYWIKLPEQTSFSSSCLHVSLYKSMHVCIPTEVAGILQKGLATMFLQINNICILSGYVLTRWKLGTNIMLPKKIRVHDINKINRQSQPNSNTQVQQTCHAEHRGSPVRKLTGRFSPQPKHRPGGARN